jgi:DNA-binding transcriptional regulator YdaS (Cro superfamily)
MRYDIVSIEGLISELGGNTAVAAWLGIHPEAVCNWKARRSIAAAWHMRLAAAVRRRNKSIDPRIFGLDPSEVRGLLE